MEYYIPNRCEEGYGISRAAVDRIRENGTTLIITVDSGITAVDEVEYAKSLGIDTVVTDHHECQERLPDAVAVVNPKRVDSRYPFKIWGRGRRGFQAGLRHEPSGESAKDHR